MLKFVEEKQPPPTGQTCAGIRVWGRCVCVCVFVCMYVYVCMRVYFGDGKPGVGWWGGNLRKMEFGIGIGTGIKVR